MDVTLVVGAGHVVCMIQHDDDDVGELYFQGFVYAILFWVLCIPTTTTSNQPTNQPELWNMHVHCPRLKNSLVRVPCLRHNCFTPIMMVCDEIKAINSTHTLHLSVQQYFAYSFKMVDFFVSQVPPITNMPHVSKVPCFAIHFKGVHIPIPNRVQLCLTFQKFYTLCN